MGLSISRKPRRPRQKASALFPTDLDRGPQCPETGHSAGSGPRHKSARCKTDNAYSTLPQLLYSVFSLQFFRQRHQLPQTVIQTGFGYRRVQNQRQLREGPVSPPSGVLGWSPPVSGQPPQPCPDWLCHSSAAGLRCCAGPFPSLRTSPAWRPPARR